MKKVIGVRFKRAGKIYYFEPGELNIQQGDGVIVETARGVEFGNVVVAPREIEETEITSPLKTVMRIATARDFEQVDKNKEKCKQAFSLANEQIAKHKLDMKLIDIEYTFDNNKIIFYFAAEGRIDFRDLVKDLASVFKTRIELRQIGVRDEAKILGGIASCGNHVCCNLFLGDFSPVSIKMAKEQNLSLSPTKISGLCGRLMCCLNYEQEYYEKTRKLMPRIGSEATTPDGVGVVIDNNVLSRKVKVKVELPDKTYEIRAYPMDEITWAKRTNQKRVPEVKPVEPIDTEELSNI